MYSSDTTHVYDSTSSDDTYHLGEKLASKLTGNETIVLTGDLGAGKTQLVRGLVAGLGSDEVVQSPTFTLSREYSCRDGLQLHHYDFYRLGEAGVVGEEFAESIEQDDVITAVEWSDVVEDIVPDDAIRIALEATGENSREITATIEL